MKALNDKQRRKMVQTLWREGRQMAFDFTKSRSRIYEIQDEPRWNETGKKVATPTEPPEQQLSKAKTPLQKGKHQMSDSSNNSDITGSRDPIEVVIYDEHDDGSFTESGCFDLIEAFDAAFGDEERKTK